MNNDERRPEVDDDYVRGGKGRRDEVGRSGVYPASAEDAPAGAKTLGQEELGHTSGGSEELMEVPKTPADEKEGEGR